MFKKEDVERGISETTELLEAAKKRKDFVMVQVLQTRLAALKRELEGFSLEKKD